MSAEERNMKMNREWKRKIRAAVAALKELDDVDIKYCAAKALCVAWVEPVARDDVRP